MGDPVQRGYRAAGVKCLAGGHDVVAFDQVLQPQRIGPFVEIPGYDAVRFLVVIQAVQDGSDLLPGLPSF